MTQKPAKSMSLITYNFWKEETAPKFTTIDEIKDASPHAPFTMDDDKTEMPILVNPCQPPALKDPPQVMVDVPAHSDILPEPCWSIHLPIHTAKANPENPLQGHIECAVQDSHEAGERLQATRAEKHQNNMVVHDPMAQHHGGGANEPAVLSDLASIATMEDIKHLFSVAALLGDPASIDLGDELRTWEEAQESLYAKEWEAGYQDGLTQGEGHL
ncbi:hypothetical protein C0995_007803 [Termitomyces sp. Mi166|nr:hypothetical protein C0995_007803 [Termitomyces sp. Mi166\